MKSAIVAIFSLWICFVTPAPSAAESDSEALTALKVPLTANGISQFFRKILSKESNLPSPAQIDQWIQQLGSRRFRDRQTAMEKLKGTLIPPIHQLTKATGHKDLEVARSAEAILKTLQSRPDPRVSALRYASQKKMLLKPSLLLQIVEQIEEEMVRHFATELLVAEVKPSDQELIRKSLIHKNVHVRAIAIQGWVALRKSDAVAEVRKFLKSPEMPIKVAAIQALVRQGEAIDFQKDLSELDLQAMATVMRTVEKQFRQSQAKNRTDPKVAKKYQELLTHYRAVLTKCKDVKQLKRKALRTQHWIKLGLSTSAHPEVLMYRIRWFNGRWSGWMVPGFNDRMKGDPRKIRFWACFNDHEHEVITTSDQKKYRPVHDLP